MSFVGDLAFDDQRALEQDALENPATAPIEPSFWDGGLDAVGSGVLRGGFEAAATVEAGFNNMLIGGMDAAADLLLPEPRNDGDPDVAAGERSLQAEQARANAELIGQLRPSAQTTGLAGQILGELAAVVPRTAGGFAAGGPLGGALAAGAPAGYSGTVLAEADGVDPRTAVQKGLIDAATYGVGALLPAARIFRAAAPDVAATVGANVGLGMAARGGTAALLESRGYTQQAQQYRALDGTAMAIDALLGGAFWGLGRAMTRAASPETIDAALAGNNGLHAQHGTAPGAPVDPRSSAAHQSALDLAIEQMARGEPVSVGDVIDGATFIRANRVGPEPEVVRQQAQQEVFAQARAELEPVAAAGLPNVRDLRAELSGLQRSLGDLQRSHEAVGDTYRDVAKAFQRDGLTRKQAERAARDSIAQQRQAIDEQRGAAQGRIDEIAQALEGNRAAERAGAELAAIDRGETPARLEPQVKQRAQEISNAFKRSTLASSVAPDHGMELNRLAGKEIERLLREGGQPLDEVPAQQTPAADAMRSAQEPSPAPIPRQETAAEASAAPPETPRPTEPAPSGEPDPLAGIDPALPGLVDSIISGERDLQIPTGAISEDGTPVTISARELLAEADAEIARAKNDSQGFMAAALCALRFGD